MGLNIRNEAFWLLDSLTGGKTKKEYSEIKKLIENSNKSYFDKLLYNILEHASETTDFYSDYKDFSSLNDFPVINKSILKNNYEMFLSKKFDKDDLINVKTSGSYGTPFTFLLSKQKKIRQRAEVIYFGEWANYKVGNKHAYIRANDNKSKLKLLMQNEIFMKTNKLDKSWLEKQRELLLDSNIKNLIGFPSAISAIAKFITDKGDNPKKFNIDGVITSGESLYDNQREIIEKTFDTICLSRYSTEELGVLAHECESEYNHHINEASYKVEVLKIDQDVPADTGEVGRIIVTDLFSHAMPLIRYETGDLGILGDRCECGLNTPILSSVEGRSLESIFTVTGDKLSPFFVNPIMKDFNKVIQFQFVQKGRINYELKIVGQLENNSLKKLRNKFIEVIGDNANLNIKFVDKIETLRSGKRAYVVNEYKKGCDDK